MTDAGHSPYWADGDRTADGPHASQPSATVVDLDGTLIATDLLHEGILAILAGNVRDVPGLITAALRGPATCKAYVATRWSPDVESLPYRKDVLEYLQNCRANGERIILATASIREWAEAVAVNVGLFDAILATTPDRNLKGTEKLIEIEHYCKGNDLHFRSYIGDSAADLPIWQACAEACLVGGSESLASRIKSSTPLAKRFAVPRRGIRTILKSLRPHQWAKNLLLFVPLVVSHRFTDPMLTGRCGLAFLAFSSLASAIYIVNDLCDLTADRAHPKKRQRPFASGTLPVSSAPLMLSILVAISSVCAWFLPWYFTACLAVYAVTSISYSLRLKALPMLDVVLLACLYTLRVIAGGAATAIKPSEWLLGFALFIFTSLAFVKRYAELVRLRSEVAETAKGRGYTVSDLPLVETLGAASGYLAVLVLALYIQSPATASLYRSPELLWLLCPLFLYWTSRLWLIGHRGELNEDPVVFALSDFTSRFVLAAAAVILFLAAKL